MGTIDLMVTTKTGGHKAGAHRKDGDDNVDGQCFSRGGW